ncbi:MAG: recombinase family protein [Pirellulales bacterium]|nr:recombinase family protein [Pirellulales bacterium]
MTTLTHAPSSLQDKRVVAYLRVSSDRQDATRQRTQIEEWAEKHGIEIVNWFDDTKGRNPRDKADKRVNFQRMLGVAESGEVDAIVVDSQDRFGTRDVYEFGHFINQLRGYGVRLWSVSQGCLSRSDDATVLQATVGALTSSREQREKGHRSITGRIGKEREGRWQGGVPPFGLDKVCFDSAGNIKWRLVQEDNRDQRVMYLPDGDGWVEHQRYDGPGNVPGRDKGDYLVLRPSIRLERIKWVRKMFQWYDEEGLSARKIAERFTDLEVETAGGKSWYKTRIQELLKNPAYIGLPAGNKRAGSRFAEYKDGEVREVDRDSGPVKMGRRREQSDWWQPDEPIFDPLVPVDLFNRVQDKIRESSELHSRKDRKPPQTARMWLKEFLVCARCGKGMHANASTKSGNIPSYFCSQYNKHGNKNESGCRCHRVKAEVLEEIVMTYVHDQHAEILEAIEKPYSGNSDSVSRCARELEDLHEERGKLFTRMGKEVGDYFEDPPMMTCIDCIDGTDHSMPDPRLWAQVYEERKPVYEAALANFESQHSRLTEELLELPKRARAKVLNKIEELEELIEQCEGQLENLSEKVDELGSLLLRRAKALEAAELVIDQDAAGKAKAAALRAVIDRIECHFIHKPTKAANRPDSILDRVEIFPASGDESVCFNRGTAPEQD